MLKITIITVCYNEKEKLKKTIQSVCGQTYEDIEYIIIDGASTDGTPDMLQKYSERYGFRFYSEEDYGIYNAMNRGIARASGDYVYFINAGDTFMSERVISDVAACMGEDRNCIYYGKVCLIFPDGLKQIQDFEKYNQDLKEILAHEEMPCHQAVFSPRKALVNHYFREQYKIRADYEWLVHSVIKGYSYKAIPVIVSRYDTSGVSGRLKNIRLFREEGREIAGEHQYEFEKGEIKFYQENREDIKFTALKYERLFQLMNYWMFLQRKGLSVGKYLRDRGYKHTAIYGMSHMGLNLLEELKKWDVAVDYAVDKKKDALYTGIKVCLPDDVLEEVDAIIVTAIDCFTEIEACLRKKLNCVILSLEDLLYEMDMMR